MSPALHTKLKELFTSMDTNGDGDLEKSEAVAFWGKNFAKVNAGAMFNEVDTDNSELITFDEWMDFWNNVLATVRNVDGVDNVHRARFWQLHEEAYAFDAHIVVHAGAWSQADAIKAKVKTVLAERFQIHQSTLELECAAHACADAPRFGS